MGIVFGVERLP
jgi:hypothetical protein